jgi:hypothetical protein
VGQPILAAAAFQVASGPSTHSRAAAIEYKEAALNPTNPRDRAVDWEADIINTFRNHPGAAKELVGERDTPTGRSLYLARPIAEDLGDELNPSRKIERPAAKRVFQAGAFHQFQNQAVSNTQRRVEGRDVGMLQAGVDFDLAQESIGKTGVFIKIGEHDFHGLLAVRDQASYAINLAHAAAAQNAGDLIIAEDVADLNSH